MCIIISTAHNCALLQFTDIDLLAVANFSNEGCTAGGVKPSEPLQFTCKIYGVVLLRVVLPTGDQETISIGDTAADVALPTGFTAVSLDITEIDDSTRNFNLTLSIDSASRLKGGNITCDDTTPGKKAGAGCLIIGKLSSTSNCSLFIICCHLNTTEINTSSISISMPVTAVECVLQSTSFIASTVVSKGKLYFILLYYWLCTPSCA